MASKAVANLKVDWGLVSSRIKNREQLNKLNKLKAQIDSTTIKCTQLPESLPKIDWEFFKANSSNPKAVEEIQKRYSSLKVERPHAPVSRLEELKQAQMQDQARLEKFLDMAKSFIESAEVVKKKFENMIPVHEMSNEDWTLTFPYWSVTLDNPSIPPHRGRAIGLTREEAALYEQPDTYPYANKQAWKDWEVRKKKFYT